MSRPSSPRRAVLGFACLCSSVLLAAAVLVVAITPSDAAWEDGPPAPKIDRDGPIALHDTFDTFDTLDDLRAAAVLGNSEASAELATQLLERFDHGGDKDDLYEAVQWVSRDWDQPAYVNSSIIDRLVGQHCDRRVLKWHWLCGGGD
jgi:hypothetical protein